MSYSAWHTPSVRFSPPMTGSIVTPLHDADVVHCAVARALYTHGPCSVATVAAISGDAEAARKVDQLATKELITAREVSISGHSVTLWFLRGGGVG